MAPVSSIGSTGPGMRPRSFSFATALASSLLYFGLLIYQHPSLGFARRRLDLSGTTRIVYRAFGTCNLLLGGRMAAFDATLRMTESGLVAEGMVARQVATHRVEPLPGRDLRTCRMDRLGGHTMTAMHLAEVRPGGHKCNHRHLDETMAYIVAGYGYTELRQSDYAAPVRAEWQAGDVVVVPTNAWHR